MNRPLRASQNDGERLRDGRQRSVARCYQRRPTESGNFARRAIGGSNVIGPSRRLMIDKAMNSFRCLLTATMGIRVAGGLSACVLAVGLLVLGGSALGQPTSNSAAVVAAGSISGQNWTLGVSNSPRHRRCFELTLTGRGYSRSARCEGSGKPRAIWQRAFGLSNDSAALELDVTEVGVRRLKLRLGFPGRRHLPSKWQKLLTRRLTAVQARNSGVNRNFRFAVVRAPSANICVEKVLAFDRFGKLLSQRSMPCEF